MSDAAAYLAQWAYELHGRSGVGMAGVAPLSYREIDAWAKLKGRHVTPWEVEALVMLDGVLCYPDEGADG